MECVNDSSFPRKQPLAIVIEELCDGCALCVDVCPAQCLEVKVNPARPNARIVTVIHALCTGCGACQGTCPKEAIFIPTLSTKDLRRYVTMALDDIHSSTTAQA